VPLHEQIERAVRDGIRSGLLVPGARLPSTRGLAAELGISRGVVSAAYDQLAAEGYLNMRQGAPVRVARSVRPAPTRLSARSLQETHRYDFDPGRPDLAGFPRERWARSLRAAWRDAPFDAAGYGDPRGAPTLRNALATYLGSVRGVAADPEHTLVCTGFMQGFSLVCRWLRGHGVERVALEDPGWHTHRLIVEQADLDVVPVGVDEHGLRVDELETTDAAAVVVTPAHQFPTGGILSRERRAALVEWAERHERLIVEDDYDAELRYDRVALGALQGLAPERVLYVGSASKRLTPGMRLGWMVMPSWLAWPLVSAKAIEDGGSEVIGQLALAHFIATGELDRHLRRMRLRYQSRRQALLRALARHLPDARAGDHAAGLYELVDLPEDVDEAQTVSAAAALGVGVEGLRLHRFSSGGRPGLVLGFAGLPEPAIEQGLRLLADAMRSRPAPATAS
jgi:GntR family transcriptional regulator/MocR family aminotransferase